MKLALIGYGKMGRMIETVAHERGHSIVAIVDPKGPHKQISQDAVGVADLCIDFTTPEAAVANIRACASLGKSLVVGTTGWHERLAIVKEIVDKAGIGLLFSPNFSIGIHLFMRLTALAGQLFDRFHEYDLAISEEHHNQKRDRPSGTAHALADLLKAEMGRYEKGGAPEISSLRCGSIPGSHKLTFDSPVDTITLTHTARSRHGLAEGAVAAAEWLQNKKGFFTLDDMLETSR